MAEGAREGPGTDVAALSAGVVAAVLTLFVDPGEYGVMSLVVSFALSIVILAFVGRQSRVWEGSLAVGAILGLALVPALGFFHEAAMRHGLWEQLFKLDYDAKVSAVPDWMVARDWLIMFVAVSCIDIALQRRWRKSAASEPVQ